MKALLLTGWMLIVAVPACFGQYPRLTDANGIGWLVYVGDHKLSANWALHTEYQWRRVGGLRMPQQNLARLGVGRTLSDRVEVSAGYTYFQSFRYGKYPEVLGKPEPENRIYEDFTLKDQLGRLSLKHRIRLEQRWLGSRGQTGQESVQEWEFQSRIRYQVSVTFPLKGATIDDREFYLNGFDELFIGFGQHVEENVFNQNRLSGGVGYQFTENTQLELNYLYQIRQHAQPGPFTNRSVVELNQGVRLNFVYNLN